MKKTRGKAAPAALTKLIQKKLRSQKIPHPALFSFGRLGGFRISSTPLHRLGCRNSGFEQDFRA
jgi:hypothetical protein